MPSRSVAVVLGTPSELIKLAGLVRTLGSAVRLLHTGRTHEAGLSEDLPAGPGLPEPTFLADVGEHPRLVRVTASMERLYEDFSAEPPGAVVVHGGTDAAVAGTLTAQALDLPLIHVEAGMRSHHRAIPDERNRALVDRLGDVLCAATPANRELLLAEGIPEHRIHVTGNTVVETVCAHLPPREEREAILARYGLVRDGYLLATVHRPEHTGDPAVLAVILAELAGLARDLPVILPLHPRTRARVDAVGLHPLLKDLTVVPLTGYGTFLALARHAALLVSDSGSLQEEATVLGRPLVAVRRSTERPEAMLHDFADLVTPGLDITDAAHRRLGQGPEELRRLAAAPSPFGDGRATERISGLIRHTIQSDRRRVAAPEDL
ncbi:UDP-N-acetyl glucosamine 2-epimerase [Streptomyces hydrogenans]|uniref:UDP-N-acetyl glucosamine 2-epimerase n=1 Tax=Streptomyces hydrogenans TaxID=1873719 RepID=UPI0035DD65DD